MDISVVVLTFNSVGCIQKCIDHAMKAIDSLNLDGEVSVFENGSTDGTVALLRRMQTERHNLRVIYSGENLGTTASRNQAIENSTGDFVLVLDSDAFITPECMQGMIDFLKKHKDYGLVGPQLTYKSGNFQLSYDDFPTIQRKFQRYLFLRGIERNAVNDIQVMDVDYLISACWLFSRDLFNKVGPLDEKIFYAPEDVDYCMRVWKAGDKIGYLPKLSMVHDAQELSRGVKINKFTFLHIKGLLYYFLKHRYLFSLKRVRNNINSIVAKSSRLKEKTPS